MALSLIGLDPAAKRSYSWAGDPACDLAHSNVEQWQETGEGLVALDGQSMTVLVCEALRPTTLQVVYGGAHGDIGNWAAVNRLAVAYSVVDIQNGPSIRRVHGPGGQLLHEEVLSTLEKQSVRIKRGDEVVTVSLLQHLGMLIIADSEAGAHPKELCVPQCTPER